MIKMQNVYWSSKNRTRAPRHSESSSAIRAFAYEFTPEADKIFPATICGFHFPKNCFACSVCKNTCGTSKSEKNKKLNMVRDRLRTLAN